jgi:small subunit ribosomal protein S7
MARRAEIPKREVLPDPVYNSQLVSKFVNAIMINGKKSIAERILYDAWKSSASRPARIR